MEENQELLFKLSIFEQQIRQLQQQIQAVEQAVVDLQMLSHGMEELKGKKGKEIFAPIGRGIFAKAQLLSEELLVDIGNGNLVKKTIAQTKDMIDKQTVKLEEVKKELNDNLEKLGVELERIMQESQENRGKE
jgi:prefoldin alpha subunit